VWSIILGLRLPVALSARKTILHVWVATIIIADMRIGRCGFPSFCSGLFTLGGCRLFSFRIFRFRCPDCLSKTMCHAQKVKMSNLLNLPCGISKREDMGKFT
jgi:hypothetical protein